MENLHMPRHKVESIQVHKAEETLRSKLAVKSYKARNSSPMPGIKASNDSVSNPDKDHSSL